MKLDQARREHERHQENADAARRRIDTLKAHCAALSPVAES
jgi:hypothetical protein